MVEGTSEQREVAWSRCEEGHESEMREEREETTRVVDAVKQSCVSGAEWEWCDGDEVLEPHSRRATWCEVDEGGIKRSSSRPSTIYDALFVERGRRPAVLT